MKRIIALIAILIIILSLTACVAKQANTMDDKILKKLMSEYKALSELPEKYDSELAKNNGDIVNIHGKGYNVEKLDSFMSSLKKKEAAMIRITQYTVEGDAVIKDLIYDGKFILLKDDNTRDQFASAENRRVIEYKVSDIIITQSSDGIEYDARIENGDMIPIILIKSK